jgi:hypothetical protein
MNNTRRFLLWVGVLLLVNSAPAQPPKPGLFVLSVGVSKYKNPRYNLKYAHKDALDLAEAWRKQTDLYEVREVKTLVNEQATRANIRAALADLKKKVSPTSLLVFVFSGHGLNDALVTHEFDNDDRTATTLGRADLTAQLSALGGNYIALIDACHSGSFAKNFSGGKDISTESRAEQDAAISSMLRALSAPDKANIVIGSSSSSEKSDECDACQNGYFTQCLLDAFEGKAVVDGRRTIRPDVDGNGFVETNELDAYIKEAVFYATRTNQFPQNVLAQQTIGYNFSIVRPTNSAGAGKPLVYDNSRKSNSVATPPDWGRPVVSEAKSVVFRTDNLPPAFTTDSDHDNVPDRFDVCPDQLGELKYWGCATDPESGSKWSQQQDGAIPTGAIQIGQSSDGKPRYLARAGNTVGYIERGSGVAKLFFQAGVMLVNVYDVLHKGHFRWQDVGPVPPGNYAPVSVRRDGTAIIRGDYAGEKWLGMWSVLPASKRTTYATIRVGPESQRVEQFSILVDEDAPVRDVGGATATPSGSQPPAPELPVADARIVRWVSPITGDFETLREDFNPDAQLQGWGYKDKLYQFSAYKTRPNGPNATVVNRWVMPNCAASIVIAEHEIPEATLLGWGYKSKQFLFYAYRNKPATGDFVAVNRWINVKPQGDKCRDFTLTVAETELTDAQLRSWGYTEKKTQFYVPRP